MVCSVVTTGRGFVVFLRRFLLLVLFLLFVWFGCGRATGSGWIVLQLANATVTRTVKAVGYTTATAWVMGFRVRCSCCQPDVVVD